MKILAMSDIHNQFDELDPALLPHADICIVAGDITNFGIQEALEFQQSQEWMRQISRRYFTYWIPGNHDLGPLDWSRYPARRARPRPTDAYSQSRCVNLLAGGVFIHRDRRWVLRGVSLSPAYAAPNLTHEWCLMTADREEEHAAYDLPYCDILVSHAPPYGVLDRMGGLHLGSKALLRYIVRYKPKLVICGHVHEGAGTAQIGDTAVHNVACQWRLIEVSK